MKHGTISQAAANLFPGYFALVMATGIISIAAHLLGMTSIAWVLLVANVAFYSVLAILLLIRLIWFPSRVAADIADHARGPGFFTVVAGTCVLGSQLFIVAGSLQIAGLLWVVGLILWLVIMYSFFALVTVRENKPPIESGLSGVWLIVVVATQSISVLGTLLAGPFGTYREPLLFFTLCMFLLGCSHAILFISRCWRG
jgi:tellurite resistance protein TehA-like permease